MGKSPGRAADVASAIDAAAAANATDKNAEVQAAANGSARSEEQLEQEAAAVVLELEGDIPGLVVRKPEGLREWYNIVQKQVTSLTQGLTMTQLVTQVKDAKARVMLSTEQFWTKKNSGQEVDTADTEWLMNR